MILPSLPSMKEGLYYLQETTLKEMLNKVSVESQTESLAPTDNKSVYLQRVMQRMFPEIRILPHSLLICQHIYSKAYTIFFINCKQVPFSNCCHEPLRIKCYPIGFGLILCTHPRCRKPEMKAFKFSDSDPKNEETINTKLSKMITIGRHKHTNLIQEKQKLGIEILQRERFITEPVESTKKSKSQSVHGKGGKNILRRPYIMKGIDLNQELV